MYPIPFVIITKEMIKELTYWFKQPNRGTQLICIAMQAIIVILLLVLEAKSDKINYKDQKRVILRVLQQ